MAEVTPSPPLAPTPAGQRGEVLAPERCAHSALMAARCSVNTNVVPLLSPRWTTLMFRSGSTMPGLLAAIAGSFHLVMAPRKMPA